MVSLYNKCALMVEVQIVLLQYSTGYYGDGRYDQIVVFPDHTHTRYCSPARCSFNVR